MQAHRARRMLRVSVVGSYSTDSALTCLMLRIIAAIEGPFDVDFV